MLKHFRDLLNDRQRIENFRQALDALIKPDTVVAEIGSAFGTYSFFAVRAGAKKVYAIEMNDVFYIGRELARRNDLDDRIEFIHGRSTEINLPEKVDLLIMEDYNPFFFYKGLTEVIRDARQRFLKPDGRFIPARLTLFLAPFECESWYAELNCFRDEQDRLFDLDWSYTTDLVFNRTYYADYRPKKLLTAPFEIKTIDLKNDRSFPFQIRTEITATQDGALHGLLGWWDCWFTESQYFSNAPCAGQSSWGQLIFPFRQPISIRRGDRMEITLRVLESQSGGMIDYKWEIDHHNGRQEQNTFSGRFFDLDQYRKVRRDLCPNLSANGAIHQFILSQIDGRRSWDEIAEKVRAAFPNQFPTRAEVFKIIGMLSDLLA